jgi:quercetin dioxygenase-like cupin family protein
MRKMIGIAAALMCVTQLGAQTKPPAPAPPILTQTGTRRIPQFENDRVRVWKSIIEPKQPLTLHRHEHGRTLVALVGGTIKIVQANGSSKTVVWETGKAYWLDADPPGQTHADVNEGPKPIEVIVIEIKN